MIKSTFYADGWRDGNRGDDANPPDVKVYAYEYLDGYVTATLRCDEYQDGYVTAIARNVDQRTFYEGANDTNADYSN